MGSIKERAYTSKLKNLNKNANSKELTIYSRGERQENDKKNY
jgi:hypothetical protein